MVAPPPEVDPVAAPALLTLTEPGAEELQVNGMPVICVPRISKTVGVMFSVVLVEEVTASVIDSHCAGCEIYWQTIDVTDGGEQGSQAGDFGGHLDLAWKQCRVGRVQRCDIRSQRLPGEDSDCGSDVYAIVVRGRLVVGGLTDGITRIRRRLLIREQEQLHRDFVDMLMNVDCGRRAADALSVGRDLGHPHRSGRADGWIAQ